MTAYKFVIITFAIACLNGCTVIAVAGTAASVAGAVVSTGIAVGSTAVSAAGTVVKAATGSGKSED